MITGQTFSSLNKTGVDVLTDRLQVLFGLSQKEADIEVDQGR